MEKMGWAELARLLAPLASLPVPFVPCRATALENFREWGREGGGANSRALIARLIWRGAWKTAADKFWQYSVHCIAIIPDHILGWSRDDVHRGRGWSGREEGEGEEAEERREGAAGAGRGGVGRGLSYSLPVTYYELIPTAPVKYYCKILTVICARERNAGTLRARVCPGAPTNCLVALSHFLSARLYPSGIYFDHPPPRQT